MQFSKKLRRFLGFFTEFQEFRTRVMRFETWKSDKKTLKKEKTCNFDTFSTFSPNRKKANFRGIKNALYNAATYLKSLFRRLY